MASDHLGGERGSDVSQERQFPTAASAAPHIPARRRSSPPRSREARPQIAALFTETSVNTFDPEQDLRALLTIGEVAAYLRVSTKTVRRYIHNQQLPSYRLAHTRTRRIRRTDVERLLVPEANAPAADGALTDFITKNQEG